MQVTNQRLDDIWRDHQEATLRHVLASEAAEQQLHEAIGELRAYREGRLPPDRLNYLIGQCAAAPAGAARHHAITEWLLLAVLNAHKQWMELAA